MGYKGVLAIDQQLDKDPRGIHMRLRLSMKKFDTNDEDNAPIEIAQAFGRPNPCYLNRCVTIQRYFSPFDVRTALL